MNLDLFGGLQLAVHENPYQPLGCHFQAPWRVCKSCVEKGQGTDRSRGVLLIPVVVLGGAEADGSQGDNSLSCGALWCY